LSQPIVIETEARDVERISISINNSISTINSQNICFWTYTVGLLAAVATGDVVGLAAVVIIESVEKQQTCKASSGSQLEGTASLSLLFPVSTLNRFNGHETYRHQ